MQSFASNNGSLSKDAPYLNALPTRNFKCQFDSRYFTSIYKIKTESVKKNVKLLFPVAHFFEARLAYLKIAFTSYREHVPLWKSPFVPNFPTQNDSPKTSQNFLFFGCNCRYSIPHEKLVAQNIKWDLWKSGKGVLSMPCRQIRAFSLLFLAIQTTFAFKFCRFGAHE